MLSIDQNSHIFWDSIAKCHALAAKGLGVAHYIEDVDVAFTEIGAKTPDEPMTLAPERFHRSGGADWGAALFYHEFLGTQPLEVHDLEPYVGMKISVLAKKLQTSVDELFDKYSPSGNHQLIGCSYIDEEKKFHRTIGDLQARETLPFIRQIIDIAHEDLLKRFPSAQSRRNISEFFDKNSSDFFDYAETLVDIYRRHFSRHSGQNICVDYTSSLLQCRENNPNLQLLNIFTRDYEKTSRLYNEAITETNQRLRHLDTEKGELPIFAIMNHSGHQVRTGVFLEGSSIRIGDMEFKLSPDGSIPFDKLNQAGIIALTGKAIVMVIQIRCGKSAQPLALPYRGSLYMPAAHKLTEKLMAEGYITSTMQPVYRVRFRLLDQMGKLDTPIILPEYLACLVGKKEIQSNEFSQIWEEVSSQAQNSLEGFRSADAREKWIQDNCPKQVQEIQQLDQLKRKIAQNDPKSAQVRQLWTKIKRLSQQTLWKLTDKIYRDYQASQLDYWDSRGGIFPVCVALGGQGFYDNVVENAELFTEGVEDDCQNKMVKSREF